MSCTGQPLRARPGTGWWVGLPLLLGTTVLIALGCGKKPGPEAGAESVRVTRHRCNIAEAHDVVDLYAEVTNRSSERTGPLDLVARVIRPEEQVIEARTSIGRLGPREVRHVSTRFTCKGRVALRHISLSVEPTKVVPESESRPPGARR